MWKLLHLRLVILVSGFRRARLSRKLVILFSALLIVAFFGFVFFLSWSLLKFLTSPELVQLIGDASLLQESVPVLIVSGAFLGVLLTSFGVLLQALYLAGDMEFLLSAPLPIRAVFLSKLLQAILPNFGLICLFALPVLYGMGASSGYNPLYYPLVLLMLVAMALAAAGLSSLLVMFVVRIFPARRVAEVLGFLGAMLSFLCSQSGQFANWEELSPEGTNQALNLAARLNTPWSPFAWVGRGLLAVGKGDWLSGAGLVTLSLCLAGLVFALALSTSERLYYSGWASMQNKRRVVKAPRTAKSSAPSPFSDLAGRLLPSDVRAILAKDFLVLRRDLRNMSQLVTPLIFGIIYTVMFLRGGAPKPSGEGDMPTWAAEMIRNAALYLNVGIALFVGWMLLGRLAGMGFSQEGKSYWLLKSAPVSVSKLITAKYLVAYLPTLALGWVFLLVISLVQRASISTLLFTLPVVALCIAGNAGLSLAFGIAGANFNWEDPRRMQRGGSGCLSALASMLYLPISLVLFFSLPIASSVLNLAEAVGQVAGFALGGIFSLACAVVPLWLVSGRVHRLGEEI